MDYAEAMELCAFADCRFAGEPALLQFTAAPSWVWHSRLVAHHNLWIALSGTASLRGEGGWQPILAGTALLLAPGQQVQIHHDARHPVVNLAAHLVLPDGSNPPRWQTRLRDLPAIQALARLALEAYAHGNGTGREMARHLVYVLLGRFWYDAAHPAADTRHGVMLQEIAKALRQQPQRPWSMAGLAARYGLSRSQLHRLFVRQYACSPMQHLTRCRLERAVGLLRESDLDLATIATACGFCDAFHFSRQFKRHHGIPPSRLRKP